MIFEINLNIFNDFFHFILLFDIPLKKVCVNYTLCLVYYLYKLYLGFANKKLV